MNVIFVDDWVCELSPFTNYAGTAAPSHLLLRVTPKNLQDAAEFWKKRPIAGFPLNGIKLTGFQDMSPVQRFPGAIYVYVEASKQFAIQPADYISQLRGLRVSGKYRKIDFASMPHLQIFIGDWAKPNFGIEQCTDLRCLRIWGFRASDGSLRPFSALAKLQQLELIQTSITCLDGVDQLEDLHSLTVAYARNLKNIGQLAGTNLRHVDFDRAKKIAEYKTLGTLPFLRQLHLNDCADIPHLRWTETLQRLETFTVVNTNVVDGDFSPLLNLPKLGFIGSFQKRHYRQNIDEMKLALSNRHA